MIKKGTLPGAWYNIMAELSGTLPHLNPASRGCLKPADIAISQSQQIMYGRLTGAKPETRFGTAEFAACPSLASSGLQYHHDAPSPCALVGHGHVEAKAQSQTAVFDADIDEAPASPPTPVTAF